MNENKYKSLPADLQKVIDENGGIEMSGQAGRRAFDDVVEPFRKQAIENGDKVTSLSQDELKRWAGRQARRFTTLGSPRLQKRVATENACFKMPVNCLRRTGGSARH